jgi:hypothetical protein
MFFVIFPHSIICTTIVISVHFLFNRFF